MLHAFCAWPTNFGYALSYLIHARCSFLRNSFNIKFNKIYDVRRECTQPDVANMMLWRWRLHGSEKYIKSRFINQVRWIITLEAENDFNRISRCPPSCFLAVFPLVMWKRMSADRCLDVKCFVMTSFNPKWSSERIFEEVYLKRVSDSFCCRW